MVKYIVLVMGLLASGMYGMERQEEISLKDAFMLVRLLQGKGEKTENIECVELSEFEQSQQPLVDEAEHKDALPSHTQTPQVIKQNVPAVMRTTQEEARALFAHKKPTHTAWTLFGWCRRKRS